MKTVSVHKASAELSKLLDAVGAGEDVVIARSDKPAVRLVPAERPHGNADQGVEAPFSVQAEDDPFEHAPDDYISKDDIAAYYRKHPGEWQDMLMRVGMSGQSEAAVTAWWGAPGAGKVFTVTRQETTAVDAPSVAETKPRVPGRFAHARGTLPPDLFEQPLDEDELAAWEGKDFGPGAP